MTKRLTRKESVEQNRARLLRAAQGQFAARGYLATSLDAIAEAAGLTKGAVYAQFAGKAEIFLAVFHEGATEAITRLVEALEAAEGEAAVTALLCDWAQACSRSGLWPMAILELSHSTTAKPEHVTALKDTLQKHWQMLGEAVSRKLGLAEDPLVLGALLHELAFAPAMKIVAAPTATDLMRMFLARRAPQVAAPQAAAPQPANPHPSAPPRPGLP